MKGPESIILEEIDKFMDDFIDRVFEHSQINLIEDGKVDTGTMLKSGNIQRAMLEKGITYSAPHSENVNYGTNPGTKVPLDALAQWCKRKLQIKNEGEAWQTAKRIQGAIYRRGIAPTFILERAVNTTRQEMGI